MNIETGEVITPDDAKRYFYNPAMTTSIVTRKTSGCIKTGKDEFSETDILVKKLEINGWESVRSSYPDNIKPGLGFHKDSIHIWFRYQNISIYGPDKEFLADVRISAAVSMSYINFEETLMELLL